MLQEDANAVARRLKGLDLVYVDPPYNQHPYGSNYFMLDLLLRYERPERISRVSGIPADWQRSGYNVKVKVAPAAEGAAGNGRRALPARVVQQRGFYIDGRDAWDAERHGNGRRAGDEV